MSDDAVFCGRDHGAVVGVLGCGRCCWEEEACFEAAAEGVLECESSEMVGWPEAEDAEVVLLEGLWLC